ncbi:hypothetical protein K1T71_014281 [Dendrolimus kikuchii]|uniref:Uncharacterized protein n=1 Tax=Dendrolimus kikuchii TaxID=765133 RepID=A0ACC1CFP9_9NEOP|nr:hypothetical protein K1T71_014281 [Dendrolimus kikuchii]
MDTLHLPTRSGTIAGRSESNPDISHSALLLESKDNVQATQRSKRYKARDENEALKLEMSEMRKQIDEMMSLLKTINETQIEKINKISEDISAIRNHVNSISNVTESLTAEQNNIGLEINDIKKANNIAKIKIATLEKGLNATETENSTCEEIMTEIYERDIRSKNLIIIGIPESNMTEPKERKRSDISAVTEILKTTANEYPTPIKTIRLGKYNSKKNRPLKAIFHSKDTVTLMLKNSQNINTETVKIYSDKTPKQQTYLKNLKEELKIRTQNGETNLRIKYTNNMPKIIKISKNDKFPIEKTAPNKLATI